MEKMFREKMYNITYNESEVHYYETNSMLAMILAGGRGSRLHDLTNKVASRPFHTAVNIVS